jgi:carboxymethylenebutenolidase
MGRIVEFAANGRMAEGYLAGNVRSGPGVVLIHELWGLVGQIKGVADRFAGAGFLVLVPDLYHGKSTDKLDDATKLAMALNIADAARDLSGAVDYLVAQRGDGGTKVGVMGFCMGGQLALFAAMEYPDRIGAVVDFYGLHPAVQIDPERLRVPVLAHFGTRDHLIPDAQARALLERLRAAGTPIEAYHYDAGHAFFDETRPLVYNPEAAALAWDRTLAFLGRYLR